VANNNTITNVYGGREIFEMYKEGTRNTGTTYSYKRYVIFDVKDVNIYYRVATEGTANEYLNDMDSKALVDFISDSGVKYGICLTASDTYSSAPIKISDVEDSISIAATVPSSKYTYTVSAYSNSAETEVIDPLSANTFGIVPSASNGRYVIYIKISMTQKDPMPWGIFNIDCN